MQFQNTAKSLKNSNAVSSKNVEDFLNMRKIATFAAVSITSQKSY